MSSSRPQSMHKTSSTAAACVSLEAVPEVVTRLSQAGFKHNFTPSAAPALGPKRVQVVGRERANAWQAFQSNSSQARVLLTTPGGIGVTRACSASMPHGPMVRPSLWAGTYFVLIRL